MTTVPMPKQGPLLPPAQRGPGGPRASDKANMVVSCRRGRLPREQEPRLEACRCVTAGAPEDSCTRTRARPGVGARKLGGRHSLRDKPKQGKTRCSLGQKHLRARKTSGISTQGVTHSESAADAERRGRKEQGPPTRGLLGVLNPSGFFPEKSVSLALGYPQAPCTAAQSLASP